MRGLLPGCDEGSQDPNLRGDLLVLGTEWISFLSSH